VRIAGGCAGRAGSDGVEEVLLDRRVDGGLSAGDPLQSVADLGGTDVLGEVAASAGTQRVDDGAVIGVGGEDEDFDLTRATSWTGSDCGSLAC
jgi:hypothetical protein